MRVEHRHVDDLLSLEVDHPEVLPLLYLHREPGLGWKDPLEHSLHARLLSSWVALPGHTRPPPVISSAILLCCARQRHRPHHDSARIQNRAVTHSREERYNQEPQTGLR